MDEKPKKYVICGHYGATNIGDESIGLALIQTLREANKDHQITVLSYDKNRSKAFYKRYFKDKEIKTAYLVPAGFRSLWRGIVQNELKSTLQAIKTCDRFVLGGGGLFTDEKIAAIFLWGLQALFALWYKKPLYLVGQSVGPLRFGISRRIVKKIFNKASYIAVRDNASKKVLIECGVQEKIYVLCDLALILDYKKIMPHNILNKKIVQKKKKKYFIVTFRGWDKKLGRMNKKIVQEVGRIIKEYKLQPVFIPFQLYKENDQVILNKKIVQKADLKKNVVQQYHDEIDTLLACFEGAEFVIGVRLHSLLFSVITDTPCVGISYSPKVSNMMHDLKISRYCLHKKEFDTQGALQKKVKRLLSEKQIFHSAVDDYKYKAVACARKQLLKVFK